MVSNQTFPNSEQDGYWASIDLHVHSIYSGGAFTPLEIIQYAKNLLLDGVGISDHHQISGVTEGQALAGRDPNFPVVISSQEISLGDHFHLLIVGPQTAWPAKNRSKLLNLIGEHHQRQGVVVLAHPWTLPRDSWAKGALKELFDNNWLDGVELFNASILKLRPDQLLELERFWNEWALPHNLAVLGGSDYHQLSKGNLIGSGRTYLKVFSSGETGHIEAIRARRTVAGLYSNSRRELGWLGSGYSFLLGTPAYQNELTLIAARLGERLTNDSSISARMRRYLVGMLAAGQIQAVKDLLDETTYSSMGPTF